MFVVSSGVTSISVQALVVKLSNWTCNHGRSDWMSVDERRLFQGTLPYGAASIVATVVTGSEVSDGVVGGGWLDVGRAEMILDCGGVVGGGWLDVGRAEMIEAKHCKVMHGDCADSLLYFLIRVHKKKLEVIHVGYNKLVRRHTNSYLCFVFSIRGTHM